MIQSQYGLVCLEPINQGLDLRGSMLPDGSAIIGSTGGEVDVAFPAGENRATTTVPARWAAIGCRVGFMSKGPSGCHGWDLDPCVALQVQLTRIPKVCLQ